MKREYFKWYSQSLHREMELLVFGHSGTKVLLIPPRKGKFYDYENWGIIEAIADKINQGYFQIFCPDSIDEESFYNDLIPPCQKILRHQQYECYMMKELIPFINSFNATPLMIAGCSLGAFHAVNLAMKYPNNFCKVIALSGRFDLTFAKGYYKDLLEGYHDENVYFSMPTQYLANLTDVNYLNDLNKLEVILAVGREDYFYDNNRYLKSLLETKHMNVHCFEWEGVSHKPNDWKEMMRIYI